jgi:hypothetical protein
LFDGLDVEDFREIGGLNQWIGMDVRGYLRRPRSFWDSRAKE